MGLFPMFFSRYLISVSWIGFLGDFLLILPLVNHHVSPPFGRVFFGSLVPSILSKSKILGNLFPQFLLGGGNSNIFYVYPYLVK